MKIKTEIGFKLMVIRLLSIFVVAFLAGTSYMEHKDLTKLSGGLLIGYLIFMLGAWYQDTKRDLNEILGIQRDGFDVTRIRD